MELNRVENRNSTIENETVGLLKLFQFLHLSDLLPSQGSADLRMAILGAGLAIEILSLRDYFVEQGRSISSITAVDLNPDGKLFTEKIGETSDIPLDYRIADAGSPDSLADEVYDLIMVRRPDVYKSELNWQRVIKNGFDHLREGGIFLVTTTEDSALELASSELGKRGHIILNTKIPEQFRGGEFFNDANVVIAQKGRV